MVLILRQAICVNERAEYCIVDRGHGATRYLVVAKDRVQHLGDVLGSASIVIDNIKGPGFTGCLVRVVVSCGMLVLLICSWQVRR